MMHFNKKCVMVFIRCPKLNSKLKIITISQLNIIDFKKSVYARLKKSMRITVKK